MSDNDLEGQGDGGGKTQECPICGAENAAGAAECAECSFTFEAEQPTDIVCQGCGAELPAGTESCFICGADIGSEEGPEQVAAEGELPLVDTEPGESPGPETSESLVCAGCGAELPAGTESCFICGAEVGEPVPEGELPIVVTEPPETSPEEPEPAIAEAEEEDVPAGEPAAEIEEPPEDIPTGEPAETPADDTLPDEDRVPEESLMCKGCSAEIPAGIPICPICDTEVDVLGPETPESDTELSGEDWDLGVVGGETVPDAEEPPEPGENEFICPSCGVPIAMGVSKCPECWVEIPEMFRCPGCSNAIPLESTSCPECFAKLQDGVLIEEPELPVEAEEPLEELMPEEDFEEFVEEETTEEVIGPGDVYTMECPFCHAIANASEDICPECGMPLIEEEEAEERPTLARKRDEPDWYRMIAMGVVVLLLVSGILPFAFPLPQVDRAQIRIDGSFDDWARVTGMDDATRTDLPANVDIISYKMLSDAFNIYFYIEVRGVAFGDTSGNTARIFIDTDQDPDTGYSIMGLGADYQIRVFGHGGSVASSSCLEFDDARAQNDFNGFETSAPSVPHAAQSPDDSGKFEVRVSLEDLGITRDQPVTAVFYMADSIGNRDYSDTPLANQGSVLFVRQSSLVPESGLLTGTSARALNLEVQAIGNPVTIDDITVPDSTVSQYDRVMNSSAVQDIVLTTNAASLAAGSFIHREASAADFTVPNTHVVVVGQGAHAYARSAPSTIQIDGAFADWNGKGMTQEDARDDVMAKNRMDAIDDPALDMLNQTTQVENNNLNIMIETAGDMFAGMWVPELEESYVFTPTTRAEDRSQPDNVFTEPPVTRTRQAEPIERPTEKPEKTGEGKVRVFIDSGASAAGYWIEGINADYLIEIMGQDGLVTGTAMYLFQGTDPNMESWTEISANVEGAASGSRVEMAIPLSGFSNTANNATAVIQLVDWNMNGDVSDLTAWDVFQSGDREGTRGGGTPASVVQGRVTDSYDILVPGATVILRDSIGRMTSYITYETSNNIANNYILSQGCSDGTHVTLYAVKGANYGTGTVILPDDFSTVPCHMPLTTPVPPTAPSGFQAAVFGTGIRLTWTADESPSNFYIHRTTNTKSYTGSSEGRYYGSAKLATLEGAAREFYDSTALQDQTYHYFIVSESATYGLHYSQELSLPVDYTAAPQISHDTFSEYHAAKVPIEATIIHDMDVQSATVYYRKGTEGVWVEAPMALSSGTTQSGEWATKLSVDTDSNGVQYQYYIQAEDGSNVGLFGGPGDPYPSPLDFTATDPGVDPYPIYGYVKWGDGTLVGAGVQVWVEWVNKSDVVINDPTPDCFPAVTNDNSQYSIDMLSYDQNTVIWANATIGGFWGYNVTSPDFPFEAGKMVNITLQTPLLEITKDAPATANPGQQMDYTITIENVGNSTAYDVTITETYPDNVTFVGSAPIDPDNLGNNTWNIGNLAPGESYVLTITVQVNSSTPLGTSLVNRADVDWYISNGTWWNTAFDTAVTFIGGALLDIDKWAPEYANPGQEMTYWLNYSNAGSEWAHNVTVVETYPPEVSFVSSIPMPNLGNNVWHLGSMGPGASNSIEITVLVNADATGIIENMANITGEGLDVNWTYAYTEIINPEITLDKDAPATANAGETIMYTITYQNTGSDTARKVVITETYPDDVTFVGANPMPTAPFIDRWYIVGDLEPGESGTIFINVTIDEGYSGTLVNLVTANYKNSLVDMPTARAWANTTVDNPYLTIDKTAPGTANSGQPITYAIIVTNIGTDTAYHVWVNDTLHGHVTFTGASPWPDYEEDPAYGWYFAEIIPGASESIEIYVDVNDDATGTITNWAFAEYRDLAGNALGPVSDSASTTVMDPEMTFTKEGPANANSGETITYWLHYANTGAAPAHNITIVEHYPDNVTFISSIPAPDFGDNVWNISSLGAGASGSIQITVTIDPDAEGILENHATLDYNDTAGQGQPTEHAWLNTTLDNPEIKVTKTAPEYANPGQDITYTITVENVGSEPAYNTVLTEHYPAGVAFVSAVPMPDNPPANNVWNLGNIPVGGVRIISITVHILEGTTGTLNNTVAVDYESSSGQEYQAIDWAETMVSWPQMNIEKTGPANSTAGSTIMYTVTYWNSGSDTAVNVTITESYPVGVTFVNATPEPTSGDHAWFIGDVEPGEGGTIFINVTISPAATGTLVNTVALNYNNTAGMPMLEETAEWAVFLTGPRMEVEKTGPETANTGETIIYTIRYENIGDDTAYDVTITEAYPEVTFVSADPEPDIGDNVWVIPVLGAGESGWINITVRVNDNAAGTITNWVYLDYENEAGVGLPTESDSWPTTILDPLMTMTKAGPAQANPGETIMYTITYQNIGNGDAVNVVITETYDADVTFVNANPMPDIDNNVWNIGDLAPGEGGVIYINVTISPTATGPIGNTATLTYQDLAGEAQAPVVRTISTDLVNPYLTIVKSGPANAAPGGLVTYTITVTNIGHHWAYNVWVNDTLPDGASFFGSVPGFVHSAPPLYAWYAGTLAPGDSYAVEITLQIDETTTGTIVNTANVTYENGAGLPYENSDTASTAIMDCEIAITKTAPATANTGQVITYTITYENTGDDWAYNVVITESYPGDVTFISAIPGPDIGNNVWLIDPLAPGAGGSIEITVRVNTGLDIDTPLVNNVQVDYENAGGIEGQNSTSAVTVIIDPALEITKTAITPVQDEVAPGGIIMYQIDYRNHGNHTAYNVVITETYPLGVTFLNADPMPNNPPANNVWNLGNLAPGANGTIFINVTVSATASGILTNQVQIVGDNDAGIQFTDHDSAETLVVGPYVEIQKSGPTNAAPGDTITYTITYMNTGPGPAYNVWVNDTLPAGVTFVSATPGYLDNDPVYSWDIGTLAPGAGGTITITVEIDNDPMLTTLVNLATVDYYTDDGLTNLVTNYANLTTVVNSPRLTITKTAPGTAVTGQTIQYVVTVENIGYNDAQNVIITEHYPAGLTFQSSLPFPPLFPTDNVWELGDMLPGQVFTLTIILLVEEEASGTLHNEVSADYNNQFGVPQPTVWAFANTIIENPLLTVDKSAPEYANTGETIYYNITVTNTGPAPAHDIWVTETYPDVTFLSSVPLPYNYGGANDTWHIPFLAAGNSYVITISVRVDATEGTLLNTVDATYNNSADWVMDPVQDTAETTVRNPDMAVTKEAPEYANPGQEITYWVNYTNTGTDRAYNVVITESYPAGVEFVSAIPLPTVGDNVWHIGDVAPGGTGSIEITVQVNQGTNGWLLNNTVSLDYDNAAGMAQPTENAWADTWVVQPQMVITKDAPDTATHGETIMYTIRYENVGTDVAYIVVIEENYTAGVTFVNATPVPDVPNYVWFIGSVSPGQVGYIYINVTINQDATGILTNRAHLDYRNSFMPLDRVSDSAQTTVVAPLMHIDKHGPATANTGQEIIYNIYYENEGTADAHNVLITDTLPPGVEYMSSSPEGTVAGQVITWNLGTLAPGEFGTITVTVTVTATTGTLLNTARADYRNVAGVEYPPVSDFFLTEIINPVLTVEKSAPATANTGQNIVYTIWVTNTGQDLAYDVVVTDTYPLGVSFVSANPPPSQGNNVWFLGNISPGDAMPIFITVTVNDYGLLVNYAEATYNNSVDIPQTPVSDTAETLVGDPEMEISKSAPATANAGETIMYTINYWNNGTSDALNVVITEHYPAEVTFVNANPAPDIDENIWVIGTVPAGGSGVIFINVTIDSGTTGFITNTVDLDYMDEAGQARPTEAAQAVTVITGPYIELSKTGPEYANPGQVIMYAITYENIGNDTAYNVWINETFPDYVTFLNSNPARASDYNWHMGDLAPGDSGTIFINVTVSLDATDILHNLVEAEFTDSVGEPYSIWDTWDTTVREPILEVIKTGPGSANPGETIEYRITVTNTGTDWAHNITITDTYPAGVTFVSAIPAPDSGNNVWELGSLAPGASTAIWIYITIGMAAEGSINNTALAEYRNAAGRDMEPASAYWVTDIVNPEISLVKTAITVVPGSAFPGEVFTYRITYTNTGTGWAYDIRITEAYPAGVTFIEATPPPTFGDNEWLFPPLAPGAGGTIDITVRVKSDAAGTLLNTVTANYQNAVGTAMEPVTVQHALSVIAPELEVTKTAPEFANTGQEILYRVTVTNIGNAPATGIVLTETYPGGVTFVTAVDYPDVGTNAWHVPDLLPGASWFVDITVLVNHDAFGILENNVAVTYRDQADNVYPAVHAQAETRVIDPWMTIEKDGPATANPGQTITYWLNYSNHGTDLAYDVVITDTLPVGVTYLSASEPPFSVVDREITWRFPTVAPGVHNISVQVLVTAASGWLHNYVTLDYGNGFRTFPQETADLLTQIIVPSMQISKSAPATANTGQTIIYTINYENTGSDWAYNVVITESYPAGVEFISAVPAPDFGDNVWDIGTVAPGGSGSIQITVRVNPDAQGVLVNTATLTYHSNVMEMPPVSDTAETMVIDPLLVITKDAPSTATQGETVIYTITVENIGRDYAYDVYVRDDYLAGVTFVSADPEPDIGNNVWNISTIAPGTSVTIKITVTFTLSASGYIVNEAYADYQDSVGEQQPRVHDTASTLVSGPSMQISKWATPYAEAGDTITYWVNFTNSGTGWATNVVVTESYPAGVTFIGAIPAPDSGNNVWEIGGMAPGASVSIMITLEVDSGMTGILTNHVSLSYGNLIGIPYPPIHATAATALGDIPNLVIEKSGPSHANAGDIITYTITYSNPSGIPALNVWINDTLPLGMQYVDSVPLPDSVAGQVITWEIGDLAPGQDGVIFLDVTVTGERYGTLTNYVVVEYRNVTGALHSRYDMADTFVGDALMEISKSGPTNADVGQVFDYTITYSNIGNDTAYNVLIVDTLPDHVSFVSSTPPGTENGQEISWLIPSVAHSTGGTITVTVQVLPAAEDSIITNQVTLDYNNTGGTPYPRESAYWNTIIGVLPDGHVTIGKWAPDEAVTGEVITYLITYENIGAGIAGDVEITETYDLAHVTFHSAYPVADIGNNVWDIGTLNPGESGTIMVNVTVNALSGTINNLVDVTWTGGSNQAHAHTVIVNPVMLLDKSVDRAIAGPGTILEYTVTYLNTGTAPAYNVMIVENYPAGVTFDDAVPPPDVGNNVWIIPLVPVGGGGTIEIRVTIDVNTGLLENEVSLDYNNSAGTPMDTEYAQAETTVSTVEMLFTKTAPATAEPGTTMEYFITIFNQGPDDADDVTVREFYPLPAGSVSFVNSWLSIDGAPRAVLLPDVGDHTWYLSSHEGLLESDHYWTLIIEVEIDEFAPDALENRAMLNYTDPLGNDIFLNATAVTVTDGPLMTLTKAASTDYVSPGQYLTYTLSYSNIGPGPAMNVVIREYYPSGVQFVTSDPLPSSGNNVWNLGTVGGINNPPNSGQIVITVRVSTSAAGQLINRATLNYQNVSGGQMPELSAYATTTVLGDVTLMHVTKTGPATATSGELVTYTITYRNIGTAMARNAYIDDVFSLAELTYVDSLPASYPVGNTRRWWLGNVGPGESGTIYVTFRVGFDISVARNRVHLNYTDSLWNSLAAEATATTWVYNPDVTISKWAPGTANSGQYIDYWLNYTNTDQHAYAHNVTVTEFYSPHVEFIYAVPAPDFGDNVWFIGDLAPGGSGFIRVRVRILETVENGTVVVNNVNLSYENKAFFPQDNATASASTLVLNPIITLEKSAPATANTGETISYFIWINNTGGAPAYGLMVTEFYPAGVSYIGANPSPNVGNNIWLIPVLANGENLVIEVSVRVRTTVESGDWLVNNVQVTCEDAAGRNLGPYTASAQTQVLDPLLTVTKTGPDIANTHQTITYTIVVENEGDGWAYDIQITEIYPSGTYQWVTFVSSGPDSPSVDDNVWNIGSLAPGTSYTLWVNVTVDVQYNITNMVTVSYNDAASQPRDPVSDTLATWIQNPHLLITKAANETAVPGGHILYNITAENIGTGSAYNVTVSELFPAGVTFVSASVPPASGNNIWFFEEMAPGFVGSLYILVRVDDDVAAGTVLLNTVNITYLNLANMSMPTAYASDTTTVIGPDMAILKTAPSYVEIGEVFNYTIQYWNNGTDWAYNVVIRDALPLGLTVVGVNPPASSSGPGFYEWVVPRVAPRTTGIIQLTVLSPRGALLVNNVTLGYENMAGFPYPQLYSVTITQVSIVPTLLPPQVTSTPPSFVWAGTQFYLYADTMSFGADIDTVMLYFTDIFGESWSGAMVPLLVSSNGSGIYRLEMPAQPYKGFVSYFVWVNDTNGNQNRTGIFDVPVRLPPYLVWGNVYSHRNLPVGDAMVLITDVQTNETVIAYTDSNGRYQVDLGTLYSGYMDGEDLTVFATDGSYYGSNVSYIDVGAFDDQSLAHPNRRVNIDMNEIPELTVVLIPILGMLVLVAFLVKRRRKEEDEAEF